jgi:spore germination protein KC
MIKRTCVFICMILILSSCGYKDIDQRFFVASIGIDPADKEGEKYKVSLKLAIPTEDIKAGGEKFQMMTEEAVSITGAVRVIKSKVDKELDFSHSKLVVFGEDFVKNNDMREVMDWFLRRRDIQRIAWVGIGRPSAEEILNVKPKFERLPSNALLLAFGETGTESSMIVSEKLFDFWKRLHERGLDPILSIIEKSPEGTFSINQAAVLDKRSAKIVLDKDETKIWNMLSNRKQKADIQVKMPDKEFFYLSVDEVKTEYRLRTAANQKPYAEVNIDLEGIVEESGGHFSRNDITENKARAEESFKKEALHLLKKLQKAEVDPFGLGLLYRATHLAQDDWRQWQEIYPDLDFKVNVKATIQATGGIH